MNVYVKNKLITTDPKKSLGQGGEAEVFIIGKDLALKIFKPPSHSDFKDNPHAQKGARMRIAEHQTKLRDFPKKGLPPKVIAPIDLATNKDGRIIKGYTMRAVSNCEVLLRFGQKSFRLNAGISNQSIVEIFRDLHPTVSQAHIANFIFGDFNNLNVLVVGNKELYVIDADSGQFGKYFCRLFTDKFVDPRLCNPNETSPMLVKPHDTDSDWYAFTLMLMESLLFVGPYGGIYNPSDKSKRIKQGQRSLKGITVFEPDVKYPKPATHFSVLPDDLLQWFYKMFKEGQRGVFPIQLLEILRWTKCIDCGAEHARSSCPICKKVAPELVKVVTTVKGTVTATRIFETRKGIILNAAFQGKKLYWLYHEDGQFKREKGEVVTKGDLSSGMRFKVRRDDTLIAKGDTLITFSPGKLTPEKLSVDTFVNLPMFDTNKDSRFWTDAGKLLKDGPFDTYETVGDVLQNQTLFWVGSKFGFGFYRAGELSVAFVFDAKSKGINDNVQLPPIRGQLIDTTCSFSNYYCWFFITTRSGGKTINQCFVIKAGGSVVAFAEAEEGDGSWLSGIRGMCAAGNFLLSATDEGIVRVEVRSDRIVQTAEFPDTEPFVDSDCHLYPGSGGIYVRRNKEIYLLEIS